MTQAGQIPSTPPAVNSGGTLIYACLEIYRAELEFDASVGQINGIYKTWKPPTGNFTTWISPEFGPGYQVEAWIAPTGTSDPKASGGTRIYQDGDASGGEFYFDYMSGVLNFIGNTMPSTFQANPTWKVFIYGYAYTGGLGLSTLGTPYTVVQYSNSGTLSAFALKAVPQDSSAGYVQIRSSTSSNNYASIYADNTGFGANVSHTLPVNGGYLIGTGDYGYPTNSGAANSLVQTTSTGSISANGKMTIFRDVPNSGGGYLELYNFNNFSARIVAPSASTAYNVAYNLPQYGGDIVTTGMTGQVSDTMLASGVTNSGSGNKIVKTDSLGSITAIGSFFTSVGSITATSGTITGKILSASQEVNVTLGSGAVILTPQTGVGSGTQVKLPKTAGIIGCSGDNTTFKLTTSPTAINASATLATADMLNGIVTSTTAAAAVTITLTVGTGVDAAFTAITGFTAATNQSWDWSIINTGATNSVTLAGASAHTTVGNLIVLPGTSGRFTTRKTASGTYITYRIA